MNGIGPFLGFISHLSLRRSAECADLIRCLDPRPGERILDIGCGDGYFSSVIARAGAEVVGIDIDRKRLRLAQGLFRHDRADCRFMDAEEMEFADQSFDKAISLCVIEHFRRDERVIERVARALKPGGQFIFSADSLSLADVTDVERLRHQRCYGVNTFYTKENVREKLGRYGFELIESRYILTTPLSLGMVRMSWALDRMHPLLAPVRGLGHLYLATTGRLISDWSERRSGRADSGMTLLVQARRL